MLSTLTGRSVRRALWYSLGLAGLWIVLALLREGTTFHLAPLLVAGAAPIVIAFDPQNHLSALQLVLPTAIGLGAALAATIVLTLVDRMAGPSLLPFGGAVAEAVLFSLAGAVIGLIVGAARLSGRA